jgi:glycosyltransferase involved in cell wall biosynthesis
MEPTSLGDHLAAVTLKPDSGCEKNSVGGSIRVLAVVPGESRGTSYVFVRRQLRSLERIGVEVREIYLRSRTSPSSIIRTWRQVRKEIASFHPHILHAHYGTVTSFLCALVQGAPLVITFRGSDLEVHPSIGWLRGKVARLLSQLSILAAHRVICVSQQLRSRLWWGKQKAVVIPTGVNLELFRPMAIEEARAVLGWDPAQPTVLFCAGTEPIAKGLGLVQAALNYAERSTGPIRLFILDGTFEPESIPLFLNAADCLAFASLREGSPNIVKEAIACNLPVVSTNVGDVSERLAGVHPSRIVRRDAAEFGVAMVEMLNTRKRSNGREKVDHFCEERVALEIRSLYEELHGVKCQYRPQT